MENNKIKRPTAESLGAKDLQIHNNIEISEKEVADKFTDKKRRSEKLATIYKYLQLDTKAHSVFQCGQYLEFKVTHNETRLNQAYFCKDRLCPMCNWRRSLKIFSQVSKVIEYLGDNYKYLFLTLTLKNVTAYQLPSAVDDILSGWRYLYNKNKQFKQSIKGTFRALEVTYNKATNTYHHHLHVVLAVTDQYFKKDYISHAKWQEIWKKACKIDYQPVVHICKVRKDKGNQYIAEVAKYAVKDNDYLERSFLDAVDQVLTYLMALYKRRLVGFTGCLQEARKQLKLDDIESGDLLNNDDKLSPDIEYIIVKYHWRSGIYERSII